MTKRKTWGEITCLTGSLRSKSFTQLWGFHTTTPPHICNIPKLALHDVNQFGNYIKHNTTERISKIISKEREITGDIKPLVLEISPFGSSS